ncbi:MAG: choice-of-anchor D domain-containing protein [Candidatus Sulfotelmatobacter sp.]
MSCWAGATAPSCPRSFFPAGNALSSLAVGDFNGDHKPDLVLGDNLYGVITLLNTGVVKFSPTTPLNFLVQLINTKSVARSATLTNTGTTALSIRSVKVTGAFQARNNCKGSVAAGGSCKITATFQPKALGWLTGLVTISDSASSKPQVVEVLGQATALQLSPTALNFGDQKVGTTSTPQQIVVTNRSSISITLTSWGIGIDGSEFSETDNCKSRLAAGATCTMMVTFAPQKTGSGSGTVYVDVGQVPTPRSRRCLGWGRSEGNP